MAARGFRQEIAGPEEERLPERTSNRLNRLHPTWHRDERCDVDQKRSLQLVEIAPQGGQARLQLPNKIDRFHGSSPVDFHWAARRGDYSRLTIRAHTPWSHE
jgi:hypothetical protein